MYLINTMYIRMYVRICRMELLTYSTVHMYCTYKSKVSDLVITLEGVGFMKFERLCIEDC